MHEEKGWVSWRPRNTWSQEQPCQSFAVEKVKWIRHSLEVKKTLVNLGLKLDTQAEMYSKLNMWSTAVRESPAEDTDLNGDRQQWRYDTENKDRAVAAENLSVGGGEPLELLIQRRTRKPKNYFIDI